ncbi:TRAP transporter large permease subunit [Phreatobacter sp.]|uniref:TRAP transporter large permease n=1 Tax=Phreatobacter sp. TaxID=1966341 RepID=UPI0022BAE8E2|nr:TRAP transporter large permease subunit [Phreatobacter sp.]MCZ8316022.1 TRAP transporter large permease subunit [Phreatobacter sp.]
MFGITIGNPELGVLMLLLFVVFIMLGFPIAFTLMALGVMFGYMAQGDIVFALVVQRTYSVMTNDVLVAIPLFIFMGYIIERANILDRLFNSVQLAIGGLPGSLAVTTLVTCTIFATATGIVGAVVTLMGLLAFPAMLRAGYDERLSAGVVCAGGCLGILIPPSVMLILYGATAGVSVPKLYAGAFLPGLLLASLYMVYVIIRCMLNPSLAPKLPKEQRMPLGFDFDKDKMALVKYVAIILLAIPVAYAVIYGLEWMLNMIRILTTPAGMPLREIDYSVPDKLPHVILGAGAIGFVLLLILGKAVFKELARSFFPLTMLILSVLGAIFFGIATPTEAAAVGAMGSVILAAAYKSISFDKLKESVFLTARTSAMVCWLFVGSFIFSSIFAILGGHEPIKAFVAMLNLSPTMFMILAQVIIFILGWPLEWTEIIVIFVPIFLPLLETFKIDPLFFGILIALNIQTSFLSPPVAMAPFYLKGVAPPHVTINQIFSGVMPFIVIVVGCMVVVYTFPGIALWLPSVLYR